jgi:alkylation response protein AidB-like acyl-CoA dehydrogenase
MLLTEEQILIRDSARRFAADHLTPNAARWDREGHFPGGQAPLRPHRSPLYLQGRV